MISLEEMREIEPSLKDKSDKEVEEIRRLLYELGNLALDRFFDSKKKES
jgi:hypothetical protein